MEAVDPSCWVKIIYLSRNHFFSPLPGDCEAGGELCRREGRRWKGAALLGNLTSECDVPALSRHTQATSLGCSGDERCAGVSSATTATCLLLRSQRHYLKFNPFATPVVLREGWRGHGDAPYRCACAAPGPYLQVLPSFGESVALQLDPHSAVSAVVSWSTSGPVPAGYPCLYCEPGQ